MMITAIIKGATEKEKILSARFIDYILYPRQMNVLKSGSLEARSGSRWPFHDSAAKSDRCELDRSEENGKI